LIAPILYIIYRTSSVQLLLRFGNHGCSQLAGSRKDTRSDLATLYIYSIVNSSRDTTMSLDFFILLLHSLLQNFFYFSIFLLCFYFFFLSHSSSRYSFFLSRSSSHFLLIFLLLHFSFNMETCDEQQKRKRKFLKTWLSDDC